MMRKFHPKSFRSMPFGGLMLLWLCAGRLHADTPRAPERIEAGRLGHMARLADGRILAVHTPGVPRHEMDKPGSEQPALVRYSSDHGRTWTEPVVGFTYPAGQGNLSYSLFPLVDRQGSIHIFALRFVRLPRAQTTGRSEVLHNVSADGGKTWSSPKPANFGHEYTGAFNSAIELRRGRLLFAVSYATDRFRGDRSEFEYQCVSVYSDDGGARWQLGSDDIRVPRGEFEGHVGALEPALVELADGRVWMLIRTQHGRFYESFSSDGGQTWTRPAATQIEAPNAPAGLLRLSDGRLVRSWNDLSEYPDKKVEGAGRQYLHLAISADDGRIWSRSKRIAEREAGESPGTSVAYPFLCETADRQVLLLYYRVGSKADVTWWNPQVDVLRIDPDWISR